MNAITKTTAELAVERADLTGYEDLLGTYESGIKEPDQSSWWEGIGKLPESGTINLYNKGNNQFGYVALMPESQKIKIKEKSAEKKKAEVLGSVTSIGEHSVICEIYLDDNQNRTINIKMPRGFFPEEIHQGTPVLIKLEENSSGIKRPRVEVREPIKNDFMKQEEENLEEIIKGL